MILFSKFALLNKVGGSSLLHLILNLKAVLYHKNIVVNYLIDKRTRY